MSTYLEHFGDNFIPVIVSEYLEHTSDRPFCWDETCPCHVDPNLIRDVHQAYQDGFITSEDATRIALGRNV